MVTVGVVVGGSVVVSLGIWKPRTTPLAEVSVMSPPMILNLGKLDQEFRKKDVYGWALQKSKKYKEFKRWSYENPNNKLLEQQQQ